MNSPQLEFKFVENSGIDYKLYYLNVREGLGNEIHFCDEAFVTYEGSLTTGYVFDSAVNPAGFNLITVGSSAGVVTGFQQGIIEFNTSTGFTDNGDGTTTFHNHGIGAVFIPSGLGYFQQPLVGVPSYSPLIFTFSLYQRTLLDHDGDNVYSYLEDVNNNGNLYDDDTDGDFGPNFIDNEDDGEDEDLDDDLDDDVDMDAEGDDGKDDATAVSAELGDEMSQRCVCWSFPSGTAIFPTAFVRVYRALYVTLFIVPCQHFLTNGCA